MVGEAARRLFRFLEKIDILVGRPDGGVEDRLTGSGKGGMKQGSGRKHNRGKHQDPQCLGLYGFHVASGGSGLRRLKKKQLAEP
jgi:hypothetical protein